MAEEGKCKSCGKTQEECKCDEMIAQLQSMREVIKKGLKGDGENGKMRRL